MDRREVVKKNPLQPRDAESEKTVILLSAPEYKTTT